MPTELALVPTLPLIAGGVVAFVTSLIATAWVRRRALSGGMLDVPNERSSHSTPTPRGGGVAIVMVALAAAVVLGGRKLDTDLLTAWLGGGAAVALIGWLDDRSSVRASVRLLVHLGAASWALYWLGGLPPLQVGDQVRDFGWAGHVLGVIGIVWALNLFNFMDGIDGIAASESAFVCFAAAGLMAGWGVQGGGWGASGALSVALGAASLGFLWWNWPRARIFMGDVGSGFLGFAVAVLAIAHAREQPVALFLWAILGAAFIADSSVTLVSRLLRRVPVYQAHRSHAYQRLADRWQGHRPVTLAFIGVNVAWLLPCAILARAWPMLAPYLALAAFAPLVAAAILLRAGRADR